MAGIIGSGEGKSRLPLSVFYNKDNRLNIRLAASFMFYRYYGSLCIEENN